MNEHIKNDTHSCMPLAASEMRTESPEPRNTPGRTRGFASVAFLVVVFALMATNATILQATETTMQTQKRAAEEATQPAALDLTLIVASSCGNCYDMSTFINNLEATSKAKIASSKTVDYASEEGAALVKQYGLKRVPAFVMKGQTEKLLSTLPSITSYTTKQEKELVSANLPPQYLEIETGKVRGEFQVTYVTEKQCPECYDPTVSRGTFQQLSMRPTEETVVDRSDPEGQELMKQYAITTTPTIILTGELGIYPGFDQIWASVGTIEPDGAYVFRSGQEKMGTYFDLAQKKAVVPEKTEQNTNTTP